MKPWIGITTYELSRGTEKDYGTLPLRVTESAFEKAIWRAGGIPVLLPQVSSLKEAKNLCERLDGVMLIGGHDVDPAYYHEEPHKKLGEIDPVRDQSDLYYIEASAQADLPVLGICRGLQLLNVAYGGSLYQDLSQNELWEIQHDQETAVSIPLHDVEVVRDSLLYQVMQSEKVRVNTVHHQAIKDLSDRFIVSAKSSDQIVEAIESVKGQEILAVQWHPELLFENSEKQLAIFKWLVAAAGLK